jgi:hypothetical protein
MNKFLRFGFHDKPPILLIRHNLFVPSVPGSEALLTTEKPVFISIRGYVKQALLEKASRSNSGLFS